MLWAPRLDYWDGGRSFGFHHFKKQTTSSKFKVLPSSPILVNQPTYLAASMYDYCFFDSFQEHFRGKKTRSEPIHSHQDCNTQLLLLLGCCIIQGHSIFYTDCQQLSRISDRNPFTTFLGDAWDWTKKLLHTNHVLQQSYGSFTKCVWISMMISGLGIFCVNWAENVLCSSTGNL